MHGDSNRIAFAGAEVFLCSRSVLPHSDAVFAWMCSLPDARAYFRVQVYFILRLHEGSVPWFIATCHTIRNYCDTAGSLMIIISLGLSYH